MIWIENIIRFFAVVLLQLLLINNLHFLGVVNPCIYIFFLLALPAEINKGWQLGIGFTMGLIIDIFCNCPGVHAAACTALCFARPYVLGHLVQDDERLVGTINAHSLGLEVYIRYLVLLTLVHHSIVFILSAFTFHAAWLTLLQILISSLITIGLILVWEITHDK